MKNHKLIPEIAIDGRLGRLAVFEVQAPEAEQIHNLPQVPVRLEELDRSGDREQNLRITLHVESVDRAWILDNVVAFLGFPGIPTELPISQCAFTP